MELAEWSDVLQVNLTGAMLCGSRRPADGRAGTRGRIVNVTSVHEHVPLGGATATSPPSTASAA